MEKNTELGSEKVIAYSEEEISRSRFEVEDLDEVIQELNNAILVASQEYEKCITHLESLRKGSPDASRFIREAEEHARDSRKQLDDLDKELAVFVSLRERAINVIKMFEEEQQKAMRLLKPLHTTPPTNYLH